MTYSRNKHANLPVAYSVKLPMKLQPTGRRLTILVQEMRLTV
jgi:hypothetical protein